MLTLLLLTAAPSLTIQSSVDGAPARPGWVYATVGQKVVMHAALRGATATHWTWLRLDPVEASVDNTTPSYHLEPIHYREVELSACADKPDCDALAAAPGTVAIVVRATLEGGGVLATPGMESTKGVYRVTFRTGDGYLGYLSELFNTPYIFGSGKDQVDNLVGADCADLAVYGRRRMGLKTQYTNTYNIDQQAPERAKAITLDEHGIALDSSGKRIAAKAGDVLHFPGSRHVGVLWEDRDPVGVLDANDLMIHTCWAPPKIEPIGATDCASLPWRVLRFK
jgi:hypothetical protein